MRSSSVPAAQRSGPLSTPSEPAPPPPLRGGGARAALPLDCAGAETGNTCADDEEEKYPMPVPLPTIEDVEKLMKGIFMDLLINGEDMAVQMAVVRKIRGFLDLIREARRTHMDRVLNTNQAEEARAEEARAEVPVNQRHAASREEPSSPPSRFFPILERDSISRVRRPRMIASQIPGESASRSYPKTEIEPLASSPKPQGLHMQTRAAVRPQPEEAAQLIQEAKQQSFVTKRERAARSRVPNDGSTRSSIGEKAKDESAIANSASTPQKARVAPPPSPSAFEQRRRALQKQKAEIKAQRESHAQEAVRKQREDIKRMTEEAKQKEQAAMEERLARLRIQRKSSFKIK